MAQVEGGGRGHRLQQAAARAPFRTVHALYAACLAWPIAWPIACHSSHQTPADEQQQGAKAVETKIKPRGPKASQADQEFIKVCCVWYNKLACQAVSWHMR